MDGTEGRPKGFVAELQRFFDSINQIDAWTGSVFVLLLFLAPPGSLLSAVGGFGMVAVLIVAFVRWVRGRNKSLPPTAS